MRYNGNMIDIYLGYMVDWWWDCTWDYDGRILEIHWNNRYIYIHIYNIYVGVSTGDLTIKRAQLMIYS